MAVEKVKGRWRENVLDRNFEKREKKESVLQRKVPVSKTKVWWTSPSKDEKYPELKIYDEKWVSRRQDYSEHFNLPSKDEDNSKKRHDEWCYRLFSPPDGNSHIQKSIFSTQPGWWSALYLFFLVCFILYFKCIIKQIISLFKSLQLFI